jgi:hypothetical protein
MHNALLKVVVGIAIKETAVVVQLNPDRTVIGREETVDAEAGPFRSATIEHHTVCLYGEGFADRREEEADSLVTTRCVLCIGRDGSLAVVMGNAP